MKFVRPYIRLDDTQIARADDVTRRRMALAIRYGRKHGNSGKVTPLEQLRGTRAEHAASLYFHTLHWNDITEGRYLDDAPDLQGGNLAVEVKSIGNANYRLVAYKIFPARAYLLVDASEHPDYWICGWLWGEQLLRRPVKHLQPGRPAHTAEQSELHDPATLRNMAYAHIA